MDFDRLTQKIRQLIAKNDLNGVFKILIEQFKEDNSIVLKSRRFVQLKKDRIEGQINDQDFSHQVNRLSKDVLDFIHLKHTRFLSEEQSAPKTTNLQEIYLLSLTRLSVLKILHLPAYQPTGLTHSEIYKKSNIRIKKYFREVLDELAVASYLEKYRLERKTHWRLTESGMEFMKNMKKSTLFEGKEKEKKVQE